MSAKANHEGGLNFFGRKFWKVKRFWNIVGDIGEYYEQMSESYWNMLRHR